MADDAYTLRRERMVQEQIAARGVRDSRILAVMGSVPRHKFVRAEDQEFAYSDFPQPIGCGQTISQPYIVALMTDMLETDPMDHVLEIGTGSGYQAVILGSLVQVVQTMEIVPELADQAEKRISDLGYRNIHVHVGDGTQGWVKESPYDGILVAAGAPAVPSPLLSQLKKGGRLVIPVGGHTMQRLEIWVNTGKGFDNRIDLAVNFVPLLGEFGWK